MILARLSIRIRITIGSFLLALGFFSVAAILVHRQVESVLDGASVAVLKSDLSPYLIELRDEPGDAIDRPGDDELIVVLDESGAVHLSTFPDALNDDLPAIDLTDRDPQTVRADGREYTVLVRTETTSTGTWTVLAARTEAASTLVLDSLTRGLVYGTIALPLLFAAASWLLTGTALRPISRLRRSAETIALSGSTESLPVTAARDEVHDLAVTLNTLIDDLRRSADREKQLVSDASHELRTPLAILQSQLELMGKSDDIESDIATARRAAARMNALVTDLLELSRVEAATAEGRSASVELVAELADAVDRARFAARMTDVTIDYRVEDSDGTAEFELSVHDFGRVVDNLVGNAARAVAPDGTVTVTLQERDGLLVSVVDDGPGMPEEFIPRAFDRFSQPDDSRSQGTGLGLAIVAAVVASAGGRVRITNLEPGLEVIVSIPSRDAGLNSRRRAP